ncbi:MAG TPA: SUF system Fe-S cluster assembly protein [Bryobacteraceae bacterium]|jgi:FeS assembly SUF system protein
MAQDLRERVLGILKTVYDPEIPVNIYELGLVYDLQVSGDGDVLVKMTLTAPNCPVAESLPNQVRQRILSVEGVTSAKVEIVFEPPWDRSKMSDAAKLALGFDLGPNIVPLTRLQR